MLWGYMLDPLVLHGQGVGSVELMAILVGSTASKLPI